jgi:hypothetical protein
MLWVLVNSEFISVNPDFELKRRKVFRVVRA